MRIPAILFLLSLTTICQAQFFKTLGFKAGITRSYFTWNYKPNSTATYVGNDRSDKAIGMVFLVTGDMVDKKYWGLNLSTGWLQRNGKVEYPSYIQQGNQISGGEIKYQTSYLTIAPAIKGKLPLGSSFNFYGQLGLRADYMLSHSQNLEYYFNYPPGYIIQNVEDLKKMNYGMALSTGFEKSFKKVIFRIEYSRLINFNKLTDVKGPRLDGLGDEGFFMKINSITSMYTLNLAFKL